MRSPLCAALLGSLLTLACAHDAAHPLETLEHAAHAANDSGVDARTLALAGFHDLLVTGDVTRAGHRFDQAIAKDKADPYALYGELLIARHAGHPERALTAALDLCERAPRHPLAAAAARYVGELSGASTVLDEQILGRAPRALEKGMEGDAAYLLRSAIVALQSLRDAPERDTTLAAMGQPEVVTLIGPLAPYQLLSFDERTPLETTGTLVTQRGPFGPTEPRAMSFPEGRFSLAGEGDLGDVYIFALDVEVTEGDEYVVRSAASAPHKVILDGTQLFERRSFAHTASTVHEQAVHLSHGWHRLLLKMCKDERATSSSLGIFRASGKPARLHFKPALGKAPYWGGASLAHERLYPRAQDLRDAIEGEAGPALATFLAVRDGMGRDRDAAKALLGAIQPPPSSPEWLELRAELALGDHTLPAKVARGRATRDLESLLDKDKRNVPALLTRASLAMEDQRLTQAMELVQQARAASPQVGFPTLLLEARIELQLGVDAQADLSALAALKVQPGLCEGLGLRYDLALRRDAVAEADALVPTLSRCPNEQARGAEHAKLRGDLEASAARYRQLLQRDPLSLALGTAAADAQISLGHYPEALEILVRQQKAWPRSAAVLKHLGELLMLTGKKEEALQKYEAALAVDGSDLSLRRTVARARTGKELLQPYAVSGDDAISAYEKNRGAEDSAATYVLDGAAIEGYADGTMVDRVHVVQKVLDQSGVQDTAEVQIPAGAQILTLRTRKADGSSLEPENIEGKDSVSLPGVQVGDYVEYEYLLAHPSRGPGVPGFTASNFYFQIARIPDTWCTYTVIGPKGSKMGVDAHNMKAPQPSLVGDREVYHQETRLNPPFIPEPESAPSATEYLPYVSVGAGALGNDGTVSAYADSYFDKGLLTTEVEVFAKEAAAGKRGAEAVRNLYSAVMQRISGRDAGLPQSAASTLAQDRGSRLWLLKASLEAVGIPARLAVVRTFSADPTNLRYPAENVLPYVCVVAFPDPRKPIWLDPVVRFAPFGELPEVAANGREAWLLPEPGRPLEKTRTPASRAPVGKRVTLDLTLAADGKLTGSGSETYVGFEAAQLVTQLEALGPSERDQALQSALSRYFNGAELSKLSIDMKHEVGAPLTVRYQFSASRFARVEGNQVTLGALTFPSFLGRRYVQVSSRRTPLYVEGTEESDTSVTLKLPAGFKLESPLPPLKANTPFGLYSRVEQQTGTTLKVTEHYRLDLARIPPDKYEEFSRFAGAVDLMQSREISLTGPGAGRFSAQR